MKVLKGKKEKETEVFSVYIKFSSHLKKKIKGPQAKTSLTDAGVQWFARCFELNCA